MRFDRRNPAPRDRGAWSGLAGLVALLAVALSFGPRGPLARPVRPATPVADSLTVEIASDGSVSTAGRSLTTPQLEERVSQEVASHGGRPDEVRIVVRVAPRARTEAASLVLARIKKAGITRVQIALSTEG